MRRALGLLLCVVLLLAGLVRFERVRCGEPRCGSAPAACCCKPNDASDLAPSCHCSDATPKSPEPAPAPRGEPRCEAAGAQPEDAGTPIVTPTPVASKGHPRPVPRSVARVVAHPRQIELRTFLI